MDQARANPRVSVRQSSAVLGTAVLISNVAQVAWLALGRRAFPAGEFGVVLAAQSLYGVLQIVIDSGVSWEGARLAAAGTLTPGQRIALTRARSALALISVAATVVVGLVGDTRVLIASAPFMFALVMFAWLNYWEPLGHGRMAPLGVYLAARSLVLAIVVFGARALGGVLPIELPGALECAVILAAGLIARQTTPSLRSVARRAIVPWRTIWRIGAPAVVGQYNYAAGTVALAVAGRTAAASVVGVSMRLVSGLGGMNGVLGPAMFPRLARVGRWDLEDVAVAGAGLAAIVAVSVVGFVVAIAVVPVISSGFLGHDDVSSRAALLLALSGGAGAGVVMQLTFVLIAVHEEHVILRAAVLGAVVLSLGVVIAIVVSAADPAVVVGAAFAAGQAATAILLVRESARRTDCPAWALRPAAASVLLLPGAASLAAWVPYGRPIAAAALALTAAGVIRVTFLRAGAGAMRRSKRSSAEVEDHPIAKSPVP
jgi:O-antigen/teichoic acid export membrane protein